MNTAHSRPIGTPIIIDPAVTYILPIIIGNVGKINISLGGTSVLIMVGVALDTVQNLESQMMMRHYKGFLD